MEGAYKTIQLESHFFNSLIMTFALDLVHKIVCYHCVFLLAGEDDLHDVISAVTGLSGRWQDLGSSLRLCSSDLDSIFSASAQTPRDCLRNVVKLWLRQSYNVCITNHSPPRTHTHTHTRMHRCVV